jgi:hypothetical protein
MAQSRLYEDCQDGTARFREEGGVLRLAFFMVLIISLSCRTYWLMVVHTTAAQKIQTSTPMYTFLANSIAETLSLVGFVVFIFIWVKSTNGAANSVGYIAHIYGVMLCIYVCVTTYIIASGLVDDDQQYLGNPVYEVAITIEALAILPLVFLFAEVGRRKIKEFGVGTNSEGVPHDRRRTAKLKKRTIQVVGVCLFSFLLRSAVFIYKPIACFVSPDLYRQANELPHAWSTYGKEYGNYQACLRYLNYSGGTFISLLYPWAFYPLPEILPAIAFLLYVAPASARCCCMGGPTKTRKSEANSACGTDLHDAAHRGEVQAVKRLLHDGGRPVANTDRLGRTALHAACRSRQFWGQHWSHAGSSKWTVVDLLMNAVRGAGVSCMQSVTYYSSR